MAETANELRETVRRRYAEAALTVTAVRPAAQSSVG